ncbi:hypothetical protein DP113_10855 [Brasilonema octagenarum UFV-E1]|uniref:Uncharacterized protein n=2 Tax=Brasilonema TaxID=383614 RepID=A0A856MDF5_9CYAN|nr:MULTISPECIES: SDR family NAD(P)-dependent oxidoreductase [Brasilonema]NMF63343.1 hypothetical protein [Brasilonema octagenarum UFV-OR1]QDL08340.1 hypothetical protein DP114_10915 [Brasilonema sennae CENA114]QDL14695.1 hypothetical protein DP113_10855 [Brasilonema octagenarum UFV-E1]
MTNHSPKIALVSGSSRGLGKSTALNLAKKEVDVIVTYHSNAEEVTKVVAQIELIGAKAVALQLDTGNTKTFDKVTFDEKNMSPKLLGQVGGRCDHCAYIVFKPHYSSQNPRCPLGGNCVPSQRERNRIISRTTTS